MTRLVAVDDDPYFLSLVQAAAEPLGIQVDSCGTIAAAHVALAQPADLLLVDGILPDGTGEKLIDHIRRAPEPRPRIAFVSAFFKDLRSFQKLRGLGVELVLHKPISAARLRAELAGLIAGGTSVPTQSVTTTSPVISIAAKMRELGQSFAASLPNRRAELVAALDHARTSGDTAALGGCCHRLAGTAGSFGYLAISDQASRLELALDAKKPLPELEKQLETLAGMLERQGGELARLPIDLLSAGWLKRALVVGTETMRTTLVAELSAQGVRTRLARTHAETLDALARGGFDAAILLASHASRESVAAVAAELPLGCPLVLIGDHPEYRSLTAGHPTATIAVDAAPESVLDACGALAGSRFRGRSVLLVEDDPDVLPVVRALLEPFGISLREARDLLDCRQMTFNEVPGVALVDARLPVWSGFEVCKHLRADERFEGMSILMLSASATPVDRLAAVEAGADDYVLKPIVGVELTTRVLQRLREHEYASLRGAGNARN